MLKYIQKKEKFNIKIGSKEINYIKWTGKHQRDYLIALEKSKETDVTDKMIFDSLIKPCIDEKNIVLSQNEQRLLLIDMRKKGIGETFEDEIECPICKNKKKVKLKLDDIIKEFKESKWDVIEKDDIKITIGEIKSNKDKDILIPSNGAIKYVFNDFFLHIKSIEYNGEVHEVKNIKIVDKFFQDMPSDVSMYFFQEYEKMTDKLVLEYDFICDNEDCDSKIDEPYVVNYDRIPGFLWV